ncbi:MAG: DNA repair protein RecN [Deltaproteobacteria bacterium HGW-Deltaproteobacteria-12]|jgi:DNA repair protein RecN (Recombination protein N)|nr:MAG: DNA repair protein RecN [Deltaproteobacteria bacterium HGW-Deltaproteobacteria-12]
MLNDLSIKNFAIIDELRVSFNKGLNIISGETGAGKSIIIGAVNLLLGERAATEMIRTKADAATVEALFDISRNKALQKKISQMGFEAGNDLVIRRVVSRTGKNRALINGQMATLANLAAVSEFLINICGQHEHQMILNAENHIDILDDFGGCLPARAAYEESYNQFQQIKAQQDKLENQRLAREEKTELIRFQLKEIEDVAPQIAEDNSLIEEKKVLVNVQKLLAAAARAYDLLYGEASSVIEKLKEVQGQIKEIKKIDAKLTLSETDVENSFFTLQDAALSLRNYSKNLFFDPARLAAIEERLEMINRLKRKHGGSLESVLQKKQEMEKELLLVSNVAGELQKLSQEELIVKARMQQRALELSQLRAKAAAELKGAVDKEISALNMPHAALEVHFQRNAASASPETYNARGGDELEFYLTANIGEEPKALNKIASGGELSRIVLALKNVLSHAGSVETIVFDEVDSGIGGATAEIVGRKLKNVAAHHQVICITHLPQIACYGDSHLRVVKKVAGGRTTTEVDELDDEEKIEEISRMLGGVDLTEMTRDHAREMLAGAGLSCLESEEDKNAKKSAHR